MEIRSLHGDILFSVQRLRNKETNEYKSYFDLTNQFKDDYISEGLKEYSCWLACNNSYKKVEDILYRHTGKQLISDQKIEQVVISKAKEISQKEALLNTAYQTETMKINVQPNIDLYDSQVEEIFLLEDGILVKGQKTSRNKKVNTENSKNIENTDNKQVWYQTDVCMLECKDGTYRYLTSGLESDTKPYQTLTNNVKRAIYQEYGQNEKPLNVVSITDGAKTIRKDLLLIFGIVIVIILDWYHLRKKLKELLSMISRSKDEKQKHLNYLRKHCWEGEADKAILYLQTEVKAKNELKLYELIGYLEKHKTEIINYKKRKECGKRIGSGRMECGVNQVVGERQKNKGMSWSKKGNKALAILKVQQLNNSWEELWNIRKTA